MDMQRHSFHSALASPGAWPGELPGVTAIGAAVVWTLTLIATGTSIGIPTGIGTATVRNPRTARRTGAETGQGIKAGVGQALAGSSGRRIQIACRKAGPALAHARLGAGAAARAVPAQRGPQPATLGRDLPADSSIVPRGEPVTPAPDHPRATLERGLR